VTDHKKGRNYETREQFAIRMLRAEVERIYRNLDVQLEYILQCQSDCTNLLDIHHQLTVQHAAVAQVIRRLVELEERVKSLENGHDSSGSGDRDQLRV
jgi:hypothetical protein